jgi:hypothetical protein
MTSKPPTSGCRCRCNGDRLRTAGACIEHGDVVQAEVHTAMETGLVQPVLAPGSGTRGSGTTTPHWRPASYSRCWRRASTSGRKAARCRNGDRLHTAGAGQPDTRRGGHRVDAAMETGFIQPVLGLVTRRSLCGGALMSGVVAGLCVGLVVLWGWEPAVDVCLLWVPRSFRVADAAVSGWLVVWSCQGTSRRASGRGLAVAVGLFCEGRCRSGVTGRGLPRERGLVRRRFFCLRSVVVGLRRLRTRRVGASMWTVFGGCRCRW